MKTLSEVIAAFESAALKAGLARNTRKTYAPIIADFVQLLKLGRIIGVQDYLDYLSTVKKLSSNSVWQRSTICCTVWLIGAPIVADASR